MTTKIVKNTTFVHIWILVLDELTQLFARKRALVSLFLYVVVVGFVVYGISSVDESITSFLKNQNAPKTNVKELVERLREFPQKKMIQTLLSWPMTLPLFQFFAVVWISELIAVVSCDMISRDRERGTLRFLLLRTSRSALFIGKFLSHFFLYVVLHAISLAVLVGVTLFLSDSLTLKACLEPLLSYSVSLVPLIALTLAITLFASSTSSSIIGALLKIHLLWLPVVVILSYGPFDLLSWKSIVGIVAPFDDYLVANVVGNGALALCFLGLSFLLFKDAEV